MKRIICCLLFVITAHQAHSQVLIALLFGDKLNSERVEFGLEGGYNFSKIATFESNQVLPKFNFGLYFNYHLKKSWYMYTGVLLKANMGSNKLTSADLATLNTTEYAQEGNYSQRIKYLVVPLLAKYQFKNRIYLEAGPQAGLMLKSWVQFDSDMDDTSAKIKNYNSGKIHNVDFGFVGGFGYKMKTKLGMSIGVKYYYGFLDVYRDIAGSHNNSIFLKLNIPIGAGKKVQSADAAKAEQ
jgi:hypothetical protein